MAMRLNSTQNTINPTQGQHLVPQIPFQVGIWNVYVMFSFGAGDSLENEFALQFVDQNGAVIFDQRYWILRNSGLVVPLQLATAFNDRLAVLQGSGGFDGTTSVSITSLRVGNL